MRYLVRPLADQIAANVKNFVDGVEALAQGGGDETIPLLLLEVSQILLAGAQLGASRDVILPDNWEPEVGEDPDLDALRTGLAEAVAAHLPGQAGRLTPHLLRHYAASELYRNGMDVFAVQEVLGHEWINTTMIYVHVHRSHVEDAWVQAGRRAAGRLGGERR